LEAPVDLLVVLALLGQVDDELVEAVLGKSRKTF